MVEKILDFPANEGLKKALALRRLKSEYNGLLIEEKGLELYLDDAAVPRTEREARQGEFKDLLLRINRLLTDIARAGHYLKSEEIRSGFDL